MAPHAPTADELLTAVATDALYGELIRRHEEAAATLRRARDGRPVSPKAPSPSAATTCCQCGAAATKCTLGTCHPTSRVTMVPTLVRELYCDAHAPPWAVRWPEAGPGPESGNAPKGTNP